MKPNLVDKTCVLFNWVCNYRKLHNTTTTEQLWQYSLLLLTKSAVAETVAVVVYWADNRHSPNDCRRFATHAANRLSPPRFVVISLYRGPLQPSKTLPRNKCITSNTHWYCTIVPFSAKMAKIGVTKIMKFTVWNSICNDAEWRGETDNRATPPVGYCPSTASFSVRPYCKNARRDRCQEYHNCFPFGGLEETTRTSSNYVDKTIQQDLRSNNLSLDEAITVAQNRALWRLMSAFGATHP